MAPPPPPLARSLGAIAAAGAAAAVGLIADRGVTNLEVAKMLDTGDTFDVAPDEVHAVIADDGVPLHVEVNNPLGMPDVEPVDQVTVVLTHGYTMNLGCWVFQRRALIDAGYRVVVWDQRGHGASGRGASSSYVIDQLGQDLSAVIGEVAPEGKLVLMGHSMGGMTLMSLGEHHPELIRERVIAAAFVGTSPGGISLANGGRVATLGRRTLELLGPGVLTPLAQRPKLVSRVIKGGRSVEYAAFARYAFGSPTPLSVVRYATDMCFSMPLDVLSDFLTTFDGFDKRPALAAYENTPVLVFNGAGDIITPPEHSELIVEALPAAEHIVVEDGGHLVMMEHPTLLNVALLELIERAATASKSARLASRKPRVRQVVRDVVRSKRVREAEREARARAAREAVESVERTAKRVAASARRPSPDEATEVAHREARVQEGIDGSRPKKSRRRVVPVPPVARRRERESTDRKVDRGAAESTKDAS